MSTKFGVDSLSRLPSTARTHRQTHKVTDTTDYPTHGSAIAGIGNEHGETG